MQGDYTKILLKAAEQLAPRESARKKCTLYTIDDLKKLRQQLELTVPQDAAVWACITILFFGLGRTGELTVKTKTGVGSFNKERHATMANVTEGVHRDTNQTYTQITLPWSKARKSAARRDHLSWVPQLGEVDPQEAFNTHKRINVPGPEEHIFTYTDAAGVRIPLFKADFEKRLKKVCRDAKVPFKACHGFRIGGTLEYLLRGVPFAEVQTIGRWSSNAFLVYLRQHAEVLTPYMQPNASLHGAFIRYVMPPVR